MNKYVGHPNQIRGIEEHILKGGKGDGMHLLQVRNGKGLEFTISVDRCADISRITFCGNNYGFFSACGYVSPAYYDSIGAGFLKSFTAGFFTTCGLTAVGSPCNDDGEDLPLHGTISNTPAAMTGAYDNGENIVITATVRDASIFGRKLVLNRKYICSCTENTITVEDTVVNEGDSVTPIMLLYHCNMGYPLLSENAEVVIPANCLAPRNDHAAKHLETHLKMEKPQPNFEECCYYYDVKEKHGTAKVGIYNKDINSGLVIAFDKNTLDKFVEWKMMGETDYVLGLEPGNCTPDGRDVLRKNHTLKFLNPSEIYNTKLTFKFIKDYTNFEEEVKC